VCVAERTEYIMIDGGVCGLWKKNSQKVQLIDLLTDSWTDRQRSAQQKTANERKKQYISLFISS